MLAVPRPLALLVLLVAVAGLRAEDPAGSVVAEVFTSHGCINCPPSDMVLSALAQRAGELDPEVVLLEFHTPFFDGGPWKDPFSSFAWGRRARSYSAHLGPKLLYAPWMVVNGRLQQKAETSVEALEKVLAANRLPRVAELEVSGRLLPGGIPGTGEARTPDQLEVSVAATMLQSIDAVRPVVYLAVYENGLLTDIVRGDNRGLSLRNAWVVRLYIGALFLKPEAGSARSNTMTFELQKSWKPRNLGVAAVLQDGQTMKIYQARRGQILHPPAQE